MLLLWERHTFDVITYCGGLHHKFGVWGRERLQCKRLFVRHILVRKGKVSKTTRAQEIRGAMWGALMRDHKPPGRRRLSPFTLARGQGWVHGVSSSEVRRSGTRATEHQNAQ